MSIYLLINKSWDGCSFTTEIKGYKDTEHGAETWIAMQNNTTNNYYYFEQVKEL